MDFAQKQQEGADEGEHGGDESTAIGTANTVPASVLANAVTMTLQMSRAQIAHSTIAL